MLSKLSLILSEATCDTLGLFQLALAQARLFRCCQQQPLVHLHCCSDMTHATRGSKKETETILLFSTDRAFETTHSFSLWEARCPTVSLDRDRPKGGPRETPPPTLTPRPCTDSVVPSLSEDPERGVGVADGGGGGADGLGPCPRVSARSHVFNGVLGQLHWTLMVLSMQQCFL